MSILLLLIETDGYEISLLQEAFNSAHINNELTVFNTGGDAMLYFENVNNRLPDIVFLDLNLPDMSGLDVLKYIHNDPRLTDMCLFIFTVNEDQESVIRSWSGGASAFLRKPINIGNMLNAIQDCNQKLDIGIHPPESTP